MTLLFRRGVWLSLAAAVFAVAFAQTVVAQQEEGRRDRGGEGRGEGRGRGGRGFGMGFGAPLIRLATIDEVQTALKLSDDQKTKIEDLDDEMRDEFRKLLDEGGEREEMQALTKTGSEKLAGIFDDEQQNRFTGIAIQVYRTGAVLMDPELAKELNVTEDQQTKLADAQRENMQAMRESFGEMRDLSDDERRAKFDELRTEADKKLAAVLTTEQKDQLEALKGEKVDIDMSQFRGGRGGRGGRDRDGDRDRGDRNRDENSDDDTSTSS